MKRVYFLHPMVRNIQQLFYYLMLNNKSIENLVWDEENPEIVFVSEHIYVNHRIFMEFKKLYSPDRIFVFHGGEAVYPDLNIFDYAICYSKYLKEFERIIPLPESYFFFGDKALEKNQLSKEDALKYLEAGRKFCCFIYSNGNAHPIRDEFFYSLSKYKKVDSLGKHLNNIGNQPTRNTENWLDLSIQQKNQYKFSIAFENITYAGCTTEKLLSTFRAHSIPIYWGDPKVSEYYNTKAFINCHEYNCLEEVFLKVIEIDHNNELWAEMISQPWQTKEQYDKSMHDYQYYQNFLYDLLQGKISKELSYVPQGAWHDLYQEWFFRYYNDMPKKIKNQLHKINFLEGNRGA